MQDTRVRETHNNFSVEQPHHSSADRPREGSLYHPRVGGTKQQFSQAHSDDRDSTIEALKQKIQRLEMNRTEPERVTNHFSNDAANHQKNGQGAQSDQGPRAKNLEEMQAYLAKAMATISEFARQLKEPTDSGPTHLDK